MSNTVFVTSVYDELYETAFSGRNNRGSHYAFSLSQIHNVKAPIFCYTDSYNFKKFMPCIKAHGHNNTRFFNFELDKFESHQKIKNIKNKYAERYVKTPAWAQRSVEIMWGKFDMLLHAAENIDASTEYMFWIDAGLSHVGILPECYNTGYSQNALKPAALDYMHRFYYDKIFNPQLSEYLISYMQDSELLFFFCTMPQHNDPSSLPKGNLKGTAVGGLFGGKTEKVIEWATKGKEIYQYLLDGEYLIKEEDILTHLINVNSDDNIKLYKFNTWYHEDWGPKLYSSERGDVSFADFFRGML